VKLYVLSPQLKAIDDCSFQVYSSLHPNDLSEAMHVHQIHDNVLLEVVERVIMFFSMQLQEQWKTLCVITPIPN
jgi:alanine-alpha-ketoisovalerate/valine-pyruvate aminotransferase